MKRNPCDSPWLPAGCLVAMVATMQTVAAAEPPMQELSKVSALEEVTSAQWIRGAGAYTLRVTLDNAVDREKRRALGAANAASNPPPPPPPDPVDRNTYFIGNTIANLRGLDPAFSCRMLTLVDGRRQARNPQAVAAMPPLHQDSRVQVWLLKADGTQVPQQSYDCRKEGDLVYINYSFAADDGGKAAAVAVRVNRDYFIEELELLADAAPQ